MKFFYDEKGQRDDLICILNCYQASLYFILKYKFDTIISPFFWMENFNTILSENRAGEFEEIYLIPQRTPLIPVEKHFPPAGQAKLTFIEELLRREKMCIIRTCGQLIPFSNDYKPGTDKTRFTANHTFLLMDFDEEFFYFVDNEWNMNIKHFVPAEFNKEVGKVERQIIADAAAFHLECHTLKTDARLFAYLQREAGRNFYRVLKQTVKNYYTPLQQSGNGITYVGREAIRRLAEIFHGECSGIHDEIYANNKSLFILVYLAVHNANKRQIVLQQCLKKNFSNDKSERLRKLKSALDRATEFRHEFHYLLLKGMLTKKMGYIPKIGDGFANLLSYEDTLVEALHHFIQDIPKNKKN